MASHLIFLLASLPGNRHSSPHCLLHNDNYDMNFNFSQVLDYQNCWPWRGCLVSVIIIKIVWPWKGCLVSDII